MISIQGLPVSAETGLIDAGGTGIGFGFLGGIVGGFLAGYVIVLLEKVFSGLPQSLNGLKAMFLYPLCSTFIVGLIMLGISGPMAAINQGMMDFLQGLYNAGPVPLGLAIGCMCAFDMGGPVNKAAYTTGTLLLTTAIEAGVGTEAYNFGTNFMAAVSAACIVPPLITTFAVIVGKKYFSQEDHDAGIVNLILGCTHITEGAIPFMTKNIWPVMPIMMLGSSIASVPDHLPGRPRSGASRRLPRAARRRWRPAVGHRDPHRHGRRRHPVRALQEVRLQQERRQDRRVARTERLSWGPAARRALSAHGPRAEKSREEHP